MLKQEKEKWSIKDRLEIAEAVFTIIVSVMAIWGTLVAWENGFWHKLVYITDKVHSKYEAEAKNILDIKNIREEVKKIEKDI